MIEEEIEIDAGEVTLAATLTRPEGRAEPPLVLCIHGSGPLDRDENVSKRQGLNIFNTFARHFAAHGIACLRYDKRGIGGSGGTYLTHSLADLVADAEACLAWCRESGRFGRLYALGHSEGTVIAPRLKRVDGLLLIAPFATPMAEILRRQAATLEAEIAGLPGAKGWWLRRLFNVLGPPTKHQARLLTRLRTTTKPTFRSAFRPVAARSLRDHLALDHGALFAGVACPTLVLSCGEDLQCPPEDGARIAAMIGPHATGVLLPGVSHILRDMEGDTGFFGYAAQMKRPIAPAVLTSITDWLLPRAATS
ncbi:MAG: alpha/beta hydrolase [Pseudomonadota bacterium]